MGKKTTHFYQEIENNPHVMHWTEMTEEHIFGPYFFKSSVTHVTYLEMFND